MPLLSTTRSLGHPPQRLADPQSLGTFDLHRRTDLTLKATIPSPHRTLARLIMELFAHLVCALQTHTGSGMVSLTGRAAKMALQVDGLTSREPSMHSVGVPRCGGSSSAMPLASLAMEAQAALPSVVTNRKNNPLLYYPRVRPP